MYTDLNTAMGHSFRIEEPSLYEDLLYYEIDLGEDVWNHFAHTYDYLTGALRIYVNGQLVMEKTIRKVKPDTAYDLFLSSHWYPLEGRMACVKVIGTSLTAAQIDEYKPCKTSKYYQQYFRSEHFINRLRI